MFISKRYRTSFLLGLAAGVVSTSLISGLVFAFYSEKEVKLVPYYLKSNVESELIDKLEKGFNDSLSRLVLSCTQETSSFFDRVCVGKIQYGGKEYNYSFQPYKLTTDRDYIVNPSNLGTHIKEETGEYTDLDER